MAATGSSMPIWAGSATRRVWPLCSASFRAWSNMASSLGSRAAPCWRAQREFGLLNGDDAASKETWNEAFLGTFVGCDPCGRIGADGYAGDGATGAAAGNAQGQAVE